MPFNEVMPKFKAGTLRSGSDKGPKVTNPKQAVAIMMSEKKKAGEGKKEYMAHDGGGDVHKLSSSKREYYEIPKEGSKPLNPENMPHSITPGGNILPATPSEELKRGGKVKKYDDGGDVKTASADVPKSSPSKIEGHISAGKEPTPSGSGPITGHVSATEYSKGGKVDCASNSKQFKQNILETAVNPTEPIGFSKGGDVGYKKPSWRRW